MDHYGVYTISELADKMGVGQPTISRWKLNKDKSIRVVQKKCKELGIYDKIFSDGNNSNNINQNNSVYKLFNILYQSHLENNSLSGLEESLKQQIVLEKIKPIFRDMYAEKNFFKYLLKGSHGNKTANLLLLNRILINYNKDEIDIKNAKDTLIKLILSFNDMEEFKKIAVGKNEKEIKNSLIDFIKNKIDDLSAYTILTNIPEVLEAIKENLTVLTKVYFIDEKKD